MQEKRRTPASFGKQMRPVTLPSLTTRARQPGAAARINEAVKDSIARMPNARAESDADSDAEYESQNESEVHLEASAEVRAMKAMNE